MMKLIMEQNLQIKKMEAEMEKLIKEKEEAIKKVEIPMDVVPIATVPITIVSIIGRAEGVEQLTEVVQNLSIQT